jgi:hypothetical protein
MIYINKITNNCDSTQRSLTISDYGIEAYGFKYFEPYIYFLWNWQGFLRISYKKCDNNWQGLASVPWYYIDFFPNDTNNYQILTHYESEYYLHYFENNTNTHTDTFTTFLPKKSGSLLIRLEYYFAHIQLQQELIQ